MEYSVGKSCGAREIARSSRVGGYLKHLGRHNTGVIPYCNSNSKVQNIYYSTEWPITDVSVNVDGNFNSTMKYVLVSIRLIKGYEVCQYATYTLYSTLVVVQPRIQSN